MKKHVRITVIVAAGMLLTYLAFINLPRRSVEPRTATVQLAIDREGRLSWNGQSVTRPQMLQRMAAAGSQATPPNLHLQVDRAAPYETVVDVITEARKARVAKVGFIAEPPGPVER